MDSDVERDGIQKSAPQVLAHFGTIVSIRKFNGDKIVKVKYKKNGADATILVQIIELEMIRPLSLVWVPVKFGREVNSGTPTEDEAEKKSHSGHVFKIDHGGKELVILTDRNTIPDKM